MEILLFSSYQYCNTYLVINEKKECIIIDPNDDFLNITKFVYKNDLHVKYLILTHGHFDHIIGLKKLYDKYNCKIIINKYDLEMLFNEKINSSNVFYNNIKFNKNDFKNDDFIFINNDCLIKLIDIDFSIIFTPFHTLGSICLYLKEYNILFTGDTLFKNCIGRYDLVNSVSDINVIKTSLNKIYQLNLNTKVYPGHGESFILKDNIINFS